MNNLKTHALGVRVLLVLGMLLVMAVASADTPPSVRADGGDTDLAHHCVNPVDGETRTAFPGGAVD